MHTHRHIHLHTHTHMYTNRQIHIYTQMSTVINYLGQIDVESHFHSTVRTVSCTGEKLDQDKGNIRAYQLLSRFWLSDL